MCVDCVWNVIAHAQKSYFVFRRNGRVHLNRRGRQFSRLLAAEVCASGVVMLDTTWFRGSVMGTGYPLHQPVSPFTSTPVRHRAPSHFNWTLPIRGASKILRTNGVVLMAVVFRTYLRYADKWQVAMAGLHHLKHFKPNLLVKSSFSSCVLEAVPCLPQSFTIRLKQTVFYKRLIC